MCVHNNGAMSPIFVFDKGATRVECGVGWLVGAPA